MIYFCVLVPRRSCLEWYGAGGGGVLVVIHGHSCMTMDPCIIAMAERMSGGGGRGGVMLSNLTAARHTYGDSVTKNIGADVVTRHYKFSCRWMPLFAGLQRIPLKRGVVQAKNYL